MLRPRSERILRVARPRSRCLKVHLLPQRGRCPVCGSAPVAGVITAAGKAAGVRYLHCGLCATAWNHVRAVCITCGGSRGVALLGIEGSDGAVQAETCDECHSYAKMLYQAKDMAVEPMADDLASLGAGHAGGRGGVRSQRAQPAVAGRMTRATFVTNASGSSDRRP